MNLTKTAIIDAFLKLLEEKPYNKITVKNIVDLCQINRNTFYYHFQNIPDLLEQVMKNDADCIIENYSSLSTPVDCILPLLKHIAKRKKLISHIYNSVQREVFLNYLDKITLYVVNEYVNKATEGSYISAEDKNLLIRLYKCTLVGVIIDWLEDEMSYDLPKAFTRTCDLLSGSVTQSLLKPSN